jgi:hypothetical protein
VIATAASRRKHRRWRQAAIYTVLLSALAFVGVMAVGMWNGNLERIIDADFKAKPSETGEPVWTPCPTNPDAIYPKPATVELLVLNGSGRTGYAAAAAGELAKFGFVDPGVGNAAHYDGVVKVRTGSLGVDGAYTLLQYLPEGAVLDLDRRQDASVDMIIGSDYKELLSTEEITYEEGSLIQPISGCREIGVLLTEMPSAPPTSSTDPAASASLVRLRLGIVPPRLGII